MGNEDRRIRRLQILRRHLDVQVRSSIANDLPLEIDLLNELIYQVDIAINERNGNG